MSVPKITVTKSDSPPTPDKDETSQLPLQEDDNRLKVSPSPDSPPPSPLSSSQPYYHHDQLVNSNGEYIQQRAHTPLREQEEKTSTDFDPSIGAKPYSPFYRHATPKVINLPFFHFGGSGSGSDRTNYGRIRYSGIMNHNGDQQQQPRTPSWPRRPRPIIMSPIPSPSSTLSLGRKRPRSVARNNMWVDERQKRGWFSRLDKKKRLGIKFMIAIVILGVIMAIGFGISELVAEEHLILSRSRSRS